MLQVSADLHRRFNGHLLFAVYVLSVASVILTNNVAAPEKILLWLVLPVFLAAIILPPDSTSPVVRHPIRQLAGSVILWACLIYIVVTIVSTIASLGLQPADGRGIRLYIRWGAELALFLTVTAYLAATFPQFIKRFLLVMAVMLSINAAVNIVAFLQTPMIMFSAYRLSAVFGTPLYQNATHLAPLYAIYAMAMMGLAATQRLSGWQAWTLGVCTSVLLPGIAMTQARGPLGAIAATGIVIALAAAPRWRWWIAGAAIVFCDVVLVVPLLREALFERGGSFRIPLGTEYLRLAEAYPWLGYGLDRSLRVEILGSAFEQPHNALVWAQLRGGVIATAAVLVMLGGSLYFAFRWWQQTRNVAPFIVVLALAVTAITEIGFLVYPYNWLWITFWLPVGIGAGAELLVKPGVQMAEPLKSPTKIRESSLPL